MSVIWGIVVHIYAALSLFPFVLLFLVWGVAYLVMKEKKKSLHLAMDCTTVFLIGAVSAMLDTVFPATFGGIWMILLFFVLLAGVLGNAQNRIRGKIDTGKLFRAVWRIGFVVLSFGYFLLLLIGIGKSYYSV